MSAPTSLDHQTKGYSLSHAYWMAQASALAYKDDPAIDQQAQAWKFDRVRHHRATFGPPFPLGELRAYTLASNDMIITAFRGTEPAQIRDWLTDSSTPPWPGPARTGFVHYGFAQALDPLYPAVKEAVTGARTNGQSVWFTGHGLGGSLAALAVARLHLEEPRMRADGLYTFGQPRTFDQALATAFNDAFNGRSYRFVNQNDIVAHMPSTPFTHADALKAIDSDGKVLDTTPGPSWRPTGGGSDAFAPDSATARAHSMNTYLAFLEKNQA
ncbi:lipase family protein [Streptomyces sp. NPDC090082]|uniref:lipase family protein n=1 Tax=unclassified Streptomyces TaxID=2593676 RepID=UPI0037F6E76C